MAARGVETRSQPLEETLVQVCEDLPDSEWDRFVLDHEEPHLEQLTSWAELKSRAGWRAVRIALKSGGKVVGCAQILETRIKGLLRVGYLSRGPLVLEERWHKPMVRCLAETAKRKGFFYLALSPAYLVQGMVPALKEGSFLVRPPQLPPEVWARATLVVDLLPTEEEILLGFGATTRNQIRRGIREGVTVRAGTSADLACFCEMVKALCERRGVRSNVPEEPLLRVLWDRFSPAGNLRLYMAEVGGKPTCGLMVFSFGKWARAWRIGWDGEHKAARPTKVLYWHAMLGSKADGRQLFDFVGIDERDAREMVEGRAKGAPFHCSISEFKFGFGGRVLLFPGEWCYFPQPLVRWMFDRIGRPILSSGWTRSLLRRMHSGTVGGAS